ncbi:GTPase-activating Rap/Ran-GAP domain-like protein 3 isoform X2 [Contarinia nasturtii]|uniref:GTPase-activating Rap/Ran-GAP domain-like protein 3 isoform X2 n=1 Tax=Contarinia nasturtii TaxID=265458 RepID=UPI0012D3863D|nr:GTPase-activating Rap/Ran-GAP domain-like protein 3 isoform X2 [Contarinia nasturtii]XP_031635964.1 GTPase-activating Rap/Ran-GAP domain-like protein 3 isoform X2 [Contarinia nasturtii]
MNMMLCFNVKLATFFRAYREESVRDRSQSLCTPPTRAPPNRDIGALRVLQRRASSVISSATELISRRGVFSRRHYGSTDQLPQTDLDALDPNCRRFRLENGESLAEIDEVFGSPSTPILENPEHQTRWYFKYFLGKLHQNYVGIDCEKNPYFLSIVSHESGNKSTPLYRAMLFRKQGAQKISLTLHQNQKPTVKQMLSHFSSMDATKTPKEIFSPDIQKDLLLLEEQEGSVNFKFGVVYMKAGQKCDDEMLSNEFGSKSFEEFLGILGEKIRLKGWERFRGGLDVKGDMTGKYSIYTLYEGHEIMFHVSTLLPFSRDNRQQVERKRHIGNDIVNIIFIDGDSCDFSPNCIKSQFTHIFAVVTKQNGIYRLSVFCDETVPPFGPTLPNPPDFQDVAAFREFLLVKLINGEKATFQTPTFSRKRERTLEMLIKDLYEEYAHDTKTNMLNRRAFSEVLYDAPRTSKLKEDARQVEFVRIGQALKLEAIVRGDAPTSLASTGPGSVFKRSPWEPQCFYAAFPYRGNMIGDSIGHDALVLACDEGTFLIREDQSYQSVFDKSFCVRQMSVVEDHGIMLIRGGSATNKDGHRIHVFRIKEFKEEIIKIRSRIDVKDRRIEKTRGCHLFAISKGGDGHLRMVVTIGRKILTFQWKYTAAWTSWCSSTNDMETVDGFLFQKEITLHDSPSIITILDTPTSASTGLLMCVGYKHHFEIVCEQTGHCTRLHDIESSKRSQSQLVTAVDLCDGHETELLLCYNHTCHFQKLQDENKTNLNEFDFHWNTSPTSIVCAFPYIIAFTPDSIEIRLLVNGSLVHTATMPELQLISSKRDIYFATTAPEFIPKDFRIGCLENEQIQESTASRRPSRINEFSNERILEIRHKIDKIEAQQRIESSEKYIPSPSKLIAQPVEKFEPPIHINTEDNFTKFLPLPRSDQSPCIQRARSLQKPKERNLADDSKRLISKSNSCGDSCTANNKPEHDISMTGKHINEPTVPPNSPKVNSTSHSPNSPTKIRLLKSPNNNRLIQFATANTESLQATEKQKPLRIFRIPLFNLTGTHSHYHIHNSTPKVSIKVPPRKIEEDGFETTEFDARTEDTAAATTTNGAAATENDQNCDMKKIRSNLQKLSTNCTNLSLFSSI